MSLFPFVRSVSPFVESRLAKDMSPARKDVSVFPSHMSVDPFNESRLGNDMSTARKHVRNSPSDMSIFRLDVSTARLSCDPATMS